MLAPTGPDEQLARALNATEDVIAALRADQWSASTVCDGWCVRDVLNHLVGGNRRFASLLNGREPSGAADYLGDDPLNRLP